MSIQEGFEKSFTKNTGRNAGKETRVRVIKETKINEGFFGDVFDTVVEVGGHKKRFIIKKYQKKGGKEL